MQKALMVALFAGFSAWTAAIAAEQVPAPASLLIDPVWKAGPTGRDLKQFYPIAALGGGVSGFAVVTCTVGGAGDLEGCAVWGEDPRGDGFGSALLKIARYMQVASASASGAPTVGRTVRLGARFTAASIAGVDDQTVEVVTVRQ